MKKESLKASLEDVGKIVKDNLTYSQRIDECINLLVEYKKELDKENTDLIEVFVKMRLVTELLRDVLYHLSEELLNAIKE